jgi:hypothetical protein
MERACDAASGSAATFSYSVGRTQRHGPEEFYDFQLRRRR